MSSVRRLVVSLDDQTLSVIENDACVHSYPVSTAIKGMGFAKDSFRTPTGTFRIIEAIGADQPSGTIFKGRLPVGLWQRGDLADQDLVLTRILRLDGLDIPNANTLERCIYIHGTNQEELIGQRAGHGCVRMRNDDMIELFNRVMVNDLVEIQPATQPCGSLLFVHLDHIIPLANEVHIYESIHPSRDLFENLPATANKVSEVIISAKAAGWIPVLLSSSPTDLAASISRLFEIEYYDVLGRLTDFELLPIICEWRRSFLPVRAMMLGHHSIIPSVYTLVDGFISTESLSLHEKLTLDSLSKVIELDDVASWSQLLHSGPAVVDNRSIHITSYN